MTPDGSAADANASIQQERTRQLFQVSPRARAISLLVALANVVGLWGSLPAERLLGWLGLVVLLSMLHWVALLRQRAAEPSVAAARRWERLFAVELAALGLAFALLPLLSFPMPAAHELLVSMSLVGLALGGIEAVGASRLVLYAFAVPPLATLIGLYALRDGNVSLGFVAIFVVCSVWVALEQRQVAKRLADGVVARLRSEELVRRVQQADAALQASVAEQQLLFDLASIGIVLTRDQQIVRANAHMAQLLGCTPSALMGKTLRALAPKGSAGDALLDVESHLPFDSDLQVCRRDGTLLWVHVSSRVLDPADRSRGAISIFADITDRREREAAMQRLAHEDALTGLPNRRLLQDRMQQAFVQAQRRGRLMAVLLIDLDGFRKINDAYGHEVGDEVLMNVARRLSACVRGSDTVSRLGGDEFVVLLNDPGRGEDAQLVAEKLVGAISEPIRSGSRTLFVSASIGICMFPRDAQDADGMLRSADAAMHRAKQAGRGAWRLHGETTLGPPAR